MTADRFRRVREVYLATLACGPHARASFLDGACADDSALRREVESLLAYASAAEPYFARALDGAGGESADQTLLVGQTLGQYEIRSLLGVGGMGEVYRARDVTLDRDVAIKVLPSFLTADPERLGRLRREARILAALNHPNIAAIYGVIEADVSTGLVLELVEGETLADRIAVGPVPVASALEWSRQMLDALEAAHHAGILHRDLKPANIKIRPDGVIKVLDFGLATTDRVSSNGVDRSATDGWSGSRSGVIFGTPPYLSPEQARGAALDTRTDVWAFGCVLFELLTGRQAFRGDTFADTVAAVLAREPLWRLLPASTPAAVRRLLHQCLEKDAQGRLAAVADARKAIVEAIVESAHPIKRWLTPMRDRRARGVALAAMALLLAVSVVWSSSPWDATSGAASTPTFTRMTFRTGFIFSGVFSPDGSTVVYSAMFDDEPLRLYQARVGSPESRSMALDDAHVVDASPTGELALMLAPTVPRWSSTGTLARMPLTGGAPRELTEKITSAAWAPDGRLAIARVVDDGYQLEYPLGTVRYRTARLIDRIAVSPDGIRVAFHEFGDVCVLDADGTTRALSSGWIAPWLQWAPDGREVWFTGSRGGWYAALHAVSLDGRERLLFEAPGVAMRLLDVAANGSVLINSGPPRKGLRTGHFGDDTERDLSWLDWAHVADISADGRSVLFSEEGVGGGGRVGGARQSSSVYVRRTDGSPAVRIGAGRAQAFSARADQALSIVGRQLMSLPVGAGSSRTLTPPDINVTSARWFPDTRHVLVVSIPLQYVQAPGRRARTFILDSETGSLRVLGDPGLIGHIVSPDGTRVIGRRADGNFEMVHVHDGSTSRVSALAREDEPLRWGSDERNVYVRQRHGAQFLVSGVDLVSSRRTVLLEHTPEPYGISALLPMAITPDGGAYTYTYARHTNDLFVVTGLR